MTEEEIVALVNNHPTIKRIREEASDPTRIPSKPEPPKPPDPEAALARAEMRAAVAVYAAAAGVLPGAVVDVLARAEAELPHMESPVDPTRKATVSEWLEGLQRRAGHLWGGRSGNGKV